ncbi:hypothetical protein D3C81_1375650 [compost metagenome]
MLVHRKSKLKLGSHSIGTGYQHGLLIFILVQTEQGAEASKIRHHFRTESPLDVFLHPFYCFIACRDIDAGAFVCFRHVRTRSLWFIEVLNRTTCCIINAFGVNS